jgi:hypothetical protein
MSSIETIPAAPRYPAKDGIFEPFVYIKTIILPRQARDKHRESTPKKMPFFAPVLSGTAHNKRNNDDDEETSQNDDVKTNK